MKIYNSDLCNSLKKEPYLFGIKMSHFTYVIIAGVVIIETGTLLSILGFIKGNTIFMAIGFAVGFCIYLLALRKPNIFEMENITKIFSYGNTAKIVSGFHKEKKQITQND